MPFLLNIIHKVSGEDLKVALIYSHTVLSEIQRLRTHVFLQSRIIYYDFDIFPFSSRQKIRKKEAMFRFVDWESMPLLFRLPVRDERRPRLLHRRQAGSAEDLRGDERSGIRPGIVSYI